VSTYRLAAEKFAKASFPSPTCNIHRLAASIFFSSLLGQRYLLLMNPKLVVSHSQPAADNLSLSQLSFQYNLKPMNSLVI
jgi:hypothetical protein